MDSEIVRRYNKEPNGPYLSDMLIEKPEDIFTDYDGVIAWNRKDLDEDFDRYLMACVEELEDLPWAIRLSLRSDQDEALERKIVYAIRNFYRYKRKDAIKTIQKLIRKTLLSAVIGFSILTIITLWNSWFAEWGNAGAIVLEGLHVAIWVTIWHAIADILFEFGPTIRRVRRCRAASEARLSFRYPES